MPSTFLAAEWNYLIMANYAVEPELLQAHLPKGTELDFHDGKTFVSLVGFLFQNTKVLGLGWPMHRNFEEVNLRFYVRRKEAGEWRRGVVFISEIVPKRAIPIIANSLFGEHYVAMPMTHIIEKHPNGTLRIRYQWGKTQWNHIEVEAENTPMPIPIGSEAEFIFEHYWGYSKNRRGETIEYQVEHPHWNIFPINKHEIQCDIKLLYGEEFAAALLAEPHSIFLADGSAVKVRWGRKIR